MTATYGAKGAAKPHGGMKLEVPQYDLVIFDEITSIIADLFGSTCVTHRAERFGTLRRLIQQGKQVLCMDAVLMNTAIEFARASKRQYAVLVNTWLPVSRLVMYPSKSQDAPGGLHRQPSCP